MFKLFIREDVLAGFGKLPGKLRAITLIKLYNIRQYGITSYLPQYVNLLDKGRFQLRFVEETDYLRVQNWVQMDGHVENGLDGISEIYFSDMLAWLHKEIIGSSCYDGDYKDEYIEIDEDWIEAQSENIFVQPAINKILETSYIDHHSTPQSFLKRTFFNNLKQIDQFKEHQRKYGGELSYRPVCKVQKVFTLDQAYLEREDAPSLRNILHDLKRSADRPIIIVNFIDEQDYLFHAQTNLIYLLTHMLRRNCDGLNIAMVNVIVRNDKDKKAYQEEYKEFFIDAPDHWGEDLRPFSVVLFSPRHAERNSGNVSQFSAACYEELYFDLFQGCRSNETSPLKKNEQYNKNLDVMVHEFYAMMHNTVPVSFIEMKNVQGENEETVQEIMNTLARCAIVLRINGSLEAIERVKRRCRRPLLSGYPYIVMVCADGDENVVTVKNRYQEKDFKLPELEDLTIELEIAYEALILGWLPGNRTIDNFYSGFDLHISERVKERCRIPNKTDIRENIK